MEIFTKSAEETKEVGQKLAASLIEAKRNHMTIGLVGDLGSGKTTFTQGFAEGLGIEKDVISPTFILMREYEAGEKNFYHVDLYRLEDSVEDEVENIGLTDIWDRKGNVVVVEWADKITDIMPKDAYWVYFENLGEGKHKIKIQEDIRV